MPDASGAPETAVFATRGNVLKLYVVRGEVVKKVDSPLKVEAASITAGTSGECDLYLADPIAAPRHCRLSAGVDGFQIEDLDSSTGTYVNGVQVAGTVAIRDGDEITLGTTRLVCKVGADAGKPLLTLDMRPRTFRFAEFKKVFPSAPAQYLQDRDLWAYSEAGTLQERAGKTFTAAEGLGKFRWLLPANLLAAAAALALLGGFLVWRGGFGEPLVDPGPLCRSHAQLFSGSPAAYTPASEVELAREQGCGVCHQTGSGVPQSKCAQCHAELFGERGQHPFRDPGDAGFNPTKTVRAWRENECVYCHQEHLGASAREAGFIPSLASTRESCDECHGGTAIATGGFATRRGADPPPMRQVAHAAYRFGHKDHVGLVDAATQQPLACDVCHQAFSEAVADGASPSQDRDRGQKDFRPVPFTTCSRCHVDNAAGGTAFGRDETLRGFWPRKRDDLGREVNVWTLSWHGARDPNARCESCHLRLHDKELRATTRATLAPAALVEAKARFEVERRTHSAQFLEHAQGQACETCHRRGVARPAPVASTGVFWHFLHMPRLAGAGAEERRTLSAACAACHDDLRGASKLADETARPFTWMPPSCSRECHVESGAPGQPDRAVLLRVLPAPGEWPKEVRNDFPHQHHLNFRPGSTLEDGCYSCHGFDAVPGGLSFASVPSTKPEASRCESCHAEHDNVAGGSCRGCHPLDRSGAWNELWGPGEPGSKTRPQKEWPEVNSFNHFSAGHKESKCTVCHDAAGDRPRSLLLAAGIKDVAIPGEDEAACRRCHLESKQRFHWR